MRFTVKPLSLKPLSLKPLSLKPLSLACALLFAFFPTALASAQTTWYVDAGASGSGSGTQADPFLRIDATVANPAVLAGDTIMVAPGDYPYEEIHFSGKDLILIGASSGVPTRLTQPGPMTATQMPFIRMSSGVSPAARVSHIVFDGFESLPGASQPVVSLINSSPIFESCLFVNNYVGDLSQVNVLSGAPTFLDCVFEASFADCGVVKSDLSDLTMRRCRWTQQEGCLVITGGSLELEDCLFDRCRPALCAPYFAHSGSAIAARNANLNLMRVTFRGNQFPSTFFSSPQHVDVVNCAVEMRHCVFQGGYFLEGNGAGFRGVGGSLLCHDSTFFQLGAERGGAIGLIQPGIFMRICASRSKPVVAGTLRRFGPAIEAVSR